MRVARRALLKGTTALAVWPGAVGAAKSRGTAAGALPMPAPVDRLPDPVPVVDPTRISFDRGWLFHEGDIATPPPKGHHATYLSVKAGNAAGAAAVDFDDSDWQAVTLPHDWASHQPFVETANVSQGYRPRGIGWYRRTFHLSPEDRGKRLELQFGAIATHATIWLNGSAVAHNRSGYNGILIDATPFARFGDEANVVAVRVDAEAMEGWWYEGAGVYRHAWLARRPSASIATDGIHCDPRLGEDGRWRVPVTATIESIAAGDVAFSVEAKLLDPAGRTIAQDETNGTVAKLARQDAILSLDAGHPALWSIESPTLHTVVVRLSRDGRVIDERRVPVGFRAIRFDADRGFFLNDRAVKIKGVCLHQDHAGVGVAVPDMLLAWRLERLKAMGCNAIRCSHNAPDEALLHLADRMGFVVMDENRQFNPAPEYLAQLEWLVRRDRNHPSVICWSVFNEEPMQGTEAGVEMVRRMAALVDRLDGSRPVTAAMNGLFYNPRNVSQVVPLMGFNYFQGDYDRFHAANPAKPITSSEDTSAFETRGAFASDHARHVITSYDDEAASWGATHRKAWQEIAKRPFVAGGFVWTGFDYHGEPTPFEWPTISSFFGILDLCGFPKTAFDIHRAAWIDDEAVVAIAPHWTWPRREGQPIKVFVASNAERVALHLNGKALGEAAVDRIMGNEWRVPYQPGLIEAIAYRGGREVARAAHQTTGAPVRLRLTPARKIMAGDGVDVQPITVDAVDAKGRHVPTANLMIEFSVTGAEIIGVGNGDPNCHESEKAPRRSLFNGLAQLIVQAGEGRGAITVGATAAGLRPAALRIDRLAIAPRAYHPTAPSLQLVDQWRRSPAFAERPDPGSAPADSDNNSWDMVRSGTLTPARAGEGRWRLYRAIVTPRRRVAAEGGVIEFTALAGRAEVWIDGRKVADKGEAAGAPLKATLAAKPGPRTIVLLIETDGDAASGIGGSVTIAVARGQ